MKKLLAIICLLCLQLAGFSQQRAKGKVTELNGQPIAGATITNLRSGEKAISDKDGAFEIPAETGATLRVESIGHSPKEISYEHDKPLAISLETHSTELDQVVVVGYGTTKKRDLTGSIASIKGAELANKPSMNPVNSIQGKVAGVLITNSGKAGASPTVRIRGVGSISNTNPLYVVDGVFLDNIDFVNAADIESMEILKDPSSLAMFGVQGANGVIIITTKRAKVGKTIINLNAYAGLQRVMDPIKVADADQFKTLYNEELFNQGRLAENLSMYTANTNWQDVIFQDAMIASTSASISSGTERNKTYFNLSYFKQDGTLKYDSYKRYTARLSDEFTVSRNFRIGADLTFSRWDNTAPSTALITNALWAAPIFSIYNQYGDYMSSPTFQRANVSNPGASLEISKNTAENFGYRAIGSAFAELKFLKHFTAKSVLYADLGFNNSRSYSPVFQIGSVQDGSISQHRDYASVNQSKAFYQTFQTDNTLSYENKFGNHSINVLGGLTTQYKYNDNVSGSRTGYSLPIPNDPDFWYLNISNDIDGMNNGGGAAEQSQLSYLFRINYGFKNKYLLNLSLRRDGTSKFSPEHAWGNFPSVGAAWVISDENFFRKNLSFIDYFKFKGSWGKLGNDKIGNYLYYSQLNTSIAGVFGTNVYPAASPIYITNPDIHWEVMEGLEYGFETMLLNRRLNFEAVYYSRKTHDILVDVPVPAAIGTGISKVNLGTILNKGFEFTAGWKDKIGKDWSYSISSNLSTNVNEVLSIGDDIKYSIINGASVTKVGLPIGSFYGYIQDGIFQSTEEIAKSAQKTDIRIRPGDIRYRDVDGNGKLDANDRTIIGSPMPDLMYGVSLGLGFKGFDLAIDMQGVSGNEILAERRRKTFAPLNYEANRLVRWTGSGTSNVEPIMDNSHAQNFEYSTYFIEPGDYFRIRNIQLGYNFKSSLLHRIGSEGMRLYVSGQNMITFQKTKGYSPEVGGSPLSSGVDEATIPIPAVFSVGVNVNF